MHKGNITRDKIITESARLFNMRGYHGCSLNDIMSATELKKGGIYNHFRNKDEIALAAFEYSFNKVLERFKDAMSVCQNSEQKLRSIIDMFADFYDHPVAEGGCPIFNTAVDSTNTHPYLTEKARDAVNTLIRYIEIKIDEGKSIGEFQVTADSEALSTLIILTMEGALIMSRVNGDRTPVLVAVNHLNQLIEKKLLK